MFPVLVAWAGWPLILFYVRYKYAPENSFLFSFAIFENTIVEEYIRKYSSNNTYVLYFLVPITVAWLRVAMSVISANWTDPSDKSTEIPSCNIVQVKVSRNTLIPNHGIKFEIEASKPRGAY